MLCITAMTGVYVGTSQSEPKRFGRKQVKSAIDRTPDFSLETVIDNKPFNSYFAADRRNPFIPVVYKKPDVNSGNPTVVKTEDPDIKWPSWTFPKPKPDPEPVTPDPPKTPVYTPGDVPVVNIPKKPDPDEKPEEPEVKPAEDTGIPVELIGFAETEGNEGRKAILANKKTGEVFTVTEGEHLAAFGMEIITITPFSIIMKMKNGEKVEFVNDILKEAHKSNAQTK